MTEKDRMKARYSFCIEMNGLGFDYAFTDVADTAEEAFRYAKANLLRNVRHPMQSKLIKEGIYHGTFELFDENGVAVIKRVVNLIFSNDWGYEDVRFEYPPET